MSLENPYYYNHDDRIEYHKLLYWNTERELTQKQKDFVYWMYKQEQIANDIYD